MAPKQSGRSSSDVNPRARISLARALSKLGYTSRSQARPLIEAGQVAVNGKTIKDPEHRIDIERDRVSVDGQAVTLASYVYFMLNKPAGVVTTRSDERGRPTVFDLLAAADLSHVSAVGRLDLASEGLLLFTNDTRWADRIASPEGHVDKIYHVQVSGPFDANVLDRMREGVTDRGESLKAKSATVLEVTDHDMWLEIVLDEGKNRQIRRMLDSFGVHVLRLKRVAIGTVKLGKLEPGDFRQLTPAEVKALTR